MADQIRLLVVEDVPQVAQYIRGLLNSQQSIKLLDVVTDGSKVLPMIGELRPDVIMVDALLQGRVKGLTLVGRIHEAGIQVPVIVLTVPQQPVVVDPSNGVHGVLGMPFTGYELVTRLQQVHQTSQTQDNSHLARMITVFARKGGVGGPRLASTPTVRTGHEARRRC